MFLSYFLLLILELMAVPLVNKPKAFHLEKDRLLEYLPSGSAMALIEDTIYIAGDDSPYLFELSSSWEHHEKHLLLHRFSGQSRIPKPIKPDFESMAEEETSKGRTLYLFGSGSKSPARDLLVQVSLSLPNQAQVQEFSLTPFYARLIRQNGGKPGALNLEGAFINHSSLYLLNRAGNQLISVPLEEFKEFLSGERQPDNINITTTSFLLPAKSTVQAGFSGACFIPGTSTVIFTTTLENTDNWIDDGEILGSYLGLIDLQSVDGKKPKLIELVTTKGQKAFVHKLESIAYSGTYQNGDIKLLAIADNDNGNTHLFEFRLLKEML